MRTGASPCVDGGGGGQALCSNDTGISLEHTIFEAQIYCGGGVAVASEAWTPNVYWCTLSASSEN